MKTVKLNKVRYNYDLIITTHLASNGGDAQDSTEVNLQANADITEAVEGSKRVGLGSRHVVGFNEKRTVSDTGGTWGSHCEKFGPPVWVESSSIY